MKRLVITMTSGSVHYSDQEEKDYYIKQVIEGMATGNVLSGSLIKIKINKIPVYVLTRNIETIREEEC